MSYGDSWSYTHRVWGIVKHNFSASLTPSPRSLPFPPLEIIKGGSCNLLLNFNSCVPCFFLISFFLVCCKQLFFSCFLGYIILLCLLQIVILFFPLTTLFPCFFGYIFFLCLLQIAILPFLFNKFLSLLSWLYHFFLSNVDNHPTFFYHSFLLALNQLEP